MRYRVYVIGYQQSWANDNRALCEQLIKECDFCVQAADGLPLGVVFQPFTIVPGKNSSPPEGVNLRCVGHEIMGKIAILEEVSS